MYLTYAASMKITALARVLPYMTLKQRRTLMKAYFMSQFGYCPLVWMNHSRSLNNRINTLHERALRLVYNDFFFYHTIEKRQPSNYASKKPAEFSN